MPIEAVKIPQNVYIEDRIIGPLTLRQIILMAIGGGISYAVYATLVKMYGTVDIVTTVVVWMPAVIFAAFAIVKINDLSLSRIVLLTAERLSKAPIRTWTPRTGISINIRVQAKLNEEENLKKRKVVQKQESEAEKKIHELSGMLDRSFEDRSTQAKTMNDVEASDAEETDTVEIPVRPAAHEQKTLPVNKNRIAVDSADTKDVMHDIVPPLMRP